MSVPANLMERLRGGVNTILDKTNGAPSPYLAPEEQAAADDRRRMAMAATLLQAAQRRPQGTGAGLMANFGGALQAGQEAQNDATAEAIRMRMLRAQMAQLSGGGQERAEPSAIREMRTLGFPLTPEGFQQYNSSKGSENAAADQLALLNGRLALEERFARIERERVEDEKKRKEADTQNAQRTNTIRRSITQTERVADLTQKLEGSLLEAGVPASSWRRQGAGALAAVGDAFGANTAKLRADLDSYDQLKKNLSDQLINLMSTGDLGQGTNNKLQQYQDALANTETSPGAIMAIQANIAQILLDEADANNIPVANRDKVEANIEKWHAYSTPQNETVIDVPAIAQSVTDIGKMGLDKLRAIDLKKLSQEEFDAVSRRFGELSGK